MGRMDEARLRRPPGHSVGCLAVGVRLGVGVGMSICLGYYMVATTVWLRAMVRFIRCEKKMAICGSAHASFGC